MPQPPTRLTPHFTLQELTRTSTGLPNKPSTSAERALYALATNILEPIRAKFGAFTPTSAFRSTAVNKAVGGASTSSHLRGEAADIVIKGVPARTVATWCKKNIPVYDQLIFESIKGVEWVHISYSATNKNRKQAFDIVDGVVKGASF